MERKIYVLLLVLLGSGACGDSPPSAPIGQPAEPPARKLQPWDLSQIVSIDVVRTMPADTTVFIRTEFANGELADLEMKFIQVVDDFLPPMPVYMLEASDSILVSLGGIAKGMSGSPVFTELGTWGAIAYGFNNQNKPPYWFFATPIEWVIGTKGTIPAAKPTTTWEDNHVVPLDIPLFSTGRNIEGVSSFLNGAITAGLTRERQTSFAAGRPLAVGLLLGEHTAAALGTISFVDGNNIFGFGHAMQLAGPVALPIIEAKVLAEISNLHAPYKFATFNPMVRGTLTEDRIPGVRGVLDTEPELVSIRSVYKFPTGGTVELTHAMPAQLPSSGMAVDLVATGFFRPLLNRVEEDPDHSIRVTSNIVFNGTDSTLARSRLYASPWGRLGPLVADAYSDVAAILAGLMSRSDYALEVREADVYVEMFSEPRFARIVEVTADTVISPGDPLDVTVGLRVGRRTDREMELTLAVPDTFIAGVYQLTAGSVATLGSDDGTEPGGFGFIIIGTSRTGGGEMLEDIFERANSEDKNVVLEVRLTPFGPSEISPADNTGSVGRGDPPGPGDWEPPLDDSETGVLVSVQEVTDLFLQGSASIQVRIPGSLGADPGSGK